MKHIRQGSKIIKLPRILSDQKISEDNQKLGLVVLLTARLFAKELTQKLSSPKNVFDRSLTNKISSMRTCTTYV